MAVNPYRRKLEPKWEEDYRKRTQTTNPENVGVAYDPKAGLGPGMKAVNVGGQLRAITESPAAVLKMANAPKSEAPEPKPPFDSAFTYDPSGYRLSAQDAENLARRRAELASGYQLDAIQKALNRRLAELSQSQEAIPQALNNALARNDEEAARAGFFTSGRRFALREKSNAEAVRQLAQILQSKNQAVTEAGDAMQGVARDQGNMVASLIDSLRRDDRDYGLRDRAQQFVEYTSGRDYNRGILESDRDYASRIADINSLLAQRDQTYRQNAALFPYKLEEAQIGNETARLNNARTVLQNEISQFEYDIANDPDVGRRAQAQLALREAQKQLALVDAQIDSQKALAEQRRSEETETTPPPDPKNITGEYLMKRWNVQNLGVTTNYSGYDKLMNEWLVEAQRGPITLEDLREYINSEWQNLTSKGIDPNSLFAALRYNLKVDQPD